MCSRIGFAAVVEISEHRWWNVPGIANEAVDAKIPSLNCDTLKMALVFFFGTQDVDGWLPARRSCGSRWMDEGWMSGSGYGGFVGRSGATCFSLDVWKRRSWMPSNGFRNRLTVSADWLEHATAVAFVGLPLLIADWSASWWQSASVVDFGRWRRVHQLQLTEDNALIGPEPDWHFHKAADVLEHVSLQTGALMKMACGFVFCSWRKRSL